MLRHAIAALVLAALPASAQDTELSTRIAQDGLAATEAHLAGLAAPEPGDHFALGAVRPARCASVAARPSWAMRVESSVSWALAGRAARTRAA
ncbi:MAG: hypothetical protein QNJ16_11615, partial [Rhodobacter sp.]|nr:hypothetical protein [Rhodobacter sp.]